jgi:hypothetical protein
MQVRLGNASLSKTSIHITANHAGRSPRVSRVGTDHFSLCQSNDSCTTIPRSSNSIETHARRLSPWRDVTIRPTSNHTNTYEQPARMHHRVDFEPGADHFPPKLYSHRQYPRDSQYPSHGAPTIFSPTNHALRLASRKPSRGEACMGG